MKEISDNIMLETEFEGVTVGAIQTPQGIVMIDTPLNPKEAQVWRTTCSRMTGGSDRLLVLLDEHFDRTAGARVMRCPIIAHDRTAQAVASRLSSARPPVNRTGSAWESCQEITTIHWVSPEITFTNTMQINWGDEPIQLEYHPGPSRGSTWVVLPQQHIAFIGDTVMPGQPPFLASADIVAWLEAIEMLKSREFKDFTLICGRGILATREDILELQKFLKSAQKTLEKLSASQATTSDAEASGFAMAEEFSSKNKSEMDLYRTRLAYGLSQYYISHFSKLLP